MTKNRKIPFIEYYLQKFVNKEDKILDIGCGPARYRFSTQALYIGLDLTKDKYSSEILRSVDVVASAEDILVAQNSFNLVIAISTFYQISNHNKALKEIYRVLKPGGRILLFDYNRLIQKRLIKSEKHFLPCWSQYELRNLIQQFGFTKCELLTRTAHRTLLVERYFWLLYQRFMSSWIIVTGLKP